MLPLREGEKIRVAIVDSHPDEGPCIQQALEDIPGCIACKLLHEFSQVEAYLFDEPAKSPIHLIIMDAFAENLDGLRLVSKLRKHPKTIRSTLLIFSANADPLAVRKCYEMGVHSYIAKPSGQDALQQKVVDAVAYWLKVSQFSLPV